MPSPSPWKSEASAALRQEMNASTPTSSLIPVNVTPGTAASYVESEANLDQSLSSQKASNREGKRFYSTSIQLLAHPLSLFCQNTLYIKNFENLV